MTGSAQKLARPATHPTSPPGTRRSPARNSETGPTQSPPKQPPGSYRGYRPPIADELQRDAANDLRDAAVAVTNTADPVLRAAVRIAIRSGNSPDAIRDTIAAANPSLTGEPFDASHHAELIRLDSPTRGTGLDHYAAIVRQLRRAVDDGKRTASDACAFAKNVAVLAELPVDEAAALAAVHLGPEARRA